MNLQPPPIRPQAPPRDLHAPPRRQQGKALHNRSGEKCGLARRAGLLTVAELFVQRDSYASAARFSSSSPSAAPRSRRRQPHRTAQTQYQPPPAPPNPPSTPGQRPQRNRLVKSQLVRITGGFRRPKAGLAARGLRGGCVRGIQGRRRRSRPTRDRGRDRGPAAGPGTGRIEWTGRGA